MNTFVKALIILIRLRSILGKSHFKYFIYTLKSNKANVRKQNLTITVLT